MSDITIFARPYFISTDPDITTGPYLHRATSYIRGEQIANFLGEKYNPQDSFENDIKIYLKPKTLDNIENGSYIDFSDAEEYLIAALQKRPKIKVIASSTASFKFLQKKFPNQIFLIPEHHCNFERLKRTRKKINTVGIITNPSPISYEIGKKVKAVLKKINLELIECYDWKNRQDVLDFYQKIDIQVVPLFASFDKVMFDNQNPVRHPTKIINAASFGIPSVASWMTGYQEYDGNYIPVQTMEELIQETEKLKNLTIYEAWSQKIIPTSENYHISNVAKLYKKLT